MFSNTNVILVVIGVFVAGFSTIFTGLNFIVTVHTLRIPGMTWYRLPLFVWALYAVSLVMVLAFAMALEPLAIGGGIIQMAFAILFGGIVLALALAVGLGSKELVSRSLEREASRTAAQGSREPVSHL